MWKKGQLLHSNSVVGQSWHWEQSMHSLEKQLFLVFFSHLTSSSWEDFGWPLKHNLGGNIMGPVSTTRLWGTDHRLVTQLNKTNNVCPKWLWQTICFFLWNAWYAWCEKCADFGNLMSVIFCQGRQHLSCVWTHRKPLKHHKAREYHSEELLDWGLGNIIREHFWKYACCL